MLYAQALQIAEPAAVSPYLRDLAWGMNKRKKKEEEEDEEDEEDEEEREEEKKEVQDEEVKEDSRQKDMVKKELQDEEKGEGTKQKEAVEKNGVKDKEEEEKVVKHDEKQTLVEKPARRCMWNPASKGDPQLLIVSAHLGLLWIAWCNSGGSLLLGQVLRAAEGFLAPFLEALRHLLVLEKRGHDAGSHGDSRSWGPC